jgi:manganese efflux pump family protein
MIEAILLAVALAMDATAVAAGRAVTGMSKRTGLVLAASFGLFQAGMAAIGWALGQSAKGFVEQWDHWIAFGLLSLIGGKMLVDAFRHGPPDVDTPRGSEMGLRTILLLSIATSIDALAAGVTLPLLSVSPIVALVLIGLASLGLSLLGAVAGAALGTRLGRRLEMLGGVTLIAIGVKTLVDHLS